MDLEAIILGANCVTCKTSVFHPRFVPEHEIKNFLDLHAGHQITYDCLVVKPVEYAGFKYNMELKNS